MRMLGGTGQGGMIYTIVVAIGGAVLLTLLFRLVTGHKSSGTGSGGIRRRGIESRNRQTTAWRAAGNTSSAGTRWQQTNTR